MGARHARVRGERYDAFIDAYVQTATSRFPNALLHWEDLGASNARRILERYRYKVCTFNDDMQGTGAVVLGGVIAAARASGVPLAEQRVVVFGAGTAGIGIADLIRDAMVREGLSGEQAISRFWCLGRHGLLVDGMASGMRDFQLSYARPAAEVRSWQRDGDGDAGGIHLLEVVRQVQPTLLIGCSTSPGAFTEEIVREMAAHTERPIIFAMSNPTPLSEAIPSDLIAWTEGRALVATGGPFPPVAHEGTTYTIGQANNALIFPGLGLGIIVARARTVSDGMLAAAAGAMAQLVDAAPLGAPLTPPVKTVRAVSLHVGVAVARAALTEGLARVELSDVISEVRNAMWEPAYRPVRAVGT
jgi:malate dehydrogenase (oxaloacetate-decarboxylating)